MRLLSILAMVCLVSTLSGCPGKKTDVETTSEPVEGASTPASEKSGDAASEEMQERKGSTSDLDPADAPTEEKK